MRNLRSKIPVVAFWWLIAIQGKTFVAPSIHAQPVPEQQDTTHRSGWGLQAIVEAKTDGSIWDDIAEDLTPGIFADVRKLRNYIRSDAYAKNRATYGELHALDDIYQKALDIEENDVQDALLAVALAVMDHKRLEFHLPLGVTIPVPLTFESDTLFNVRLRNLPAHVYPDSPRDWFGDKDKSQHFFGSAYLMYLFRSRGIADFIGNAVEWEESLWGFEGAEDPRDVRSNRHGQDFGAALLKNPTTKPSDIIRCEIAFELMQRPENLLLTLVK